MTPAGFRFPLVVTAWMVAFATLGSAVALAQTPQAAQTPPAPPAAQAPPAARPAAPPPDGITVDTDPIRCWWRTSAGAVRTGETFTLLLTCAVVETDAVQIVPDEARLGSSVIQMAPFEIVTGSHPADQHTGIRRFFQYEYVLRMINPDFIGHDVQIPDLSIHYRVNTRMAGDAALQGRDLTYLLPAAQVRVLSMVGPDAFDIRDSSSESFAAVESLNFRASMLRIVAITLVALGGLVGIMTLVRLFGMARRRTPAEEQMLSPGVVLATAGAELSAIQRESEGGWNDALTSRALSAARIVAGYAVGVPASQAIVDSDTLPGEGLLIRGSRRGKTTAVWSTVTAQDLAALKGKKARSAERQSMLEGLQTTLTALTTTAYARNQTMDRSALDAAVSRAVEALRSIKTEHAWPKQFLRRLTGKEATPKDRP